MLDRHLPDHPLDSAGRPQSLPLRPIIHNTILPGVLL
jgi:hypothetical protein